MRPMRIVHPIDPIDTVHGLHPMNTVEPIDNWGVKCLYRGWAQGGRVSIALSRHNRRRRRRGSSRNVHLQKIVGYRIGGGDSVVRCGFCRLDNLLKRRNVWGSSHEI